MTLSLRLRCHKSSNWPRFKIWIDAHLLLDQMADRESIDLEFDLSLINPGSYTLIIEHYDKQDHDTWCDNEGNIIADRAVELVSLIIDGFVIPRNIIFSKKFYPQWPKHFDSDSMPQFITQNTFFGFNGQYKFDFNLPMASEYYGYFWQMEIDANRNFTKVDENQEEYFEAYGMKIKIDQDLDFDLNDLKQIIDRYEQR